MDFFGEQDRARKQSYLLLALFSVVMIGYAMVVHTVVFFVVNGFTSGSFLSVGELNTSVSASQISMVVTATLCGFVLYGCWSRYRDVQGGGSQLARRYGATEIDNSASGRSDRCFMGVAAEMSVAASIAVPATFCLRQEAAINAFVVGSGDDMALVVSQGALDKLDREELLGVVGHEFGHLANGDLAYNMRLLVVLGGLNSLDELGKKLLNASRFKSSSSARADVRRSISIFCVVVGVLIRLIGSIGVLAGNLVKASFSRQREYLADASSIQFTRNTYGLASALHKVRDSGARPALFSNYKQELAHMCFHSTSISFFLGKIFDTHPPVGDRIDAIDRHFSVKLRNRKAKSKRGSETQASGGAVGAKSKDGTTVELPENILALVEDKALSQAVLTALFISPVAAQSENDYSALRFAFTTEFSEDVRNIRDSLGKALDENKLAIIDKLTPILNQTGPTAQKVLLSNIEKLIDANSENAFENMAALQIVRRKIATGAVQSDPHHQAESAKKQSLEKRSISDLGAELSLLLSIMVKASGHNDERVNDEYCRVLKCYTSQTYPLRSMDEEGVMDEMQEAFNKLLQQPYLQRKAFVEHCAEIMQYDGINMTEELALVKLFAASLDLPAQAAA